jgi:hypothetical protein
LRQSKNEKRVFYFGPNSWRNILLGHSRPKFARLAFRSKPVRMPMQAATGLLALAAAAAFEVDTPGRCADSHAWSSAVPDSATVIQPKREHAVDQDQDSTLPQAADITHEITALAPRVGGNSTSATDQRQDSAVNALDGQVPPTPQATADPSTLQTLAPRAGGNYTSATDQRQDSAVNALDGQVPTTVQATADPSTLQTLAPRVGGNSISATDQRQDSAVNALNAPKGQVPTTPQATGIMRELPDLSALPALAPRAGGNYTSATYQRAKEAPSWVCKVPMRDGIALYVPTKSQRVKILQVLEHFLEHNIPTLRDGPCHPLLGISAFSNAKTVRLGLAECLSPTSASLKTKQDNLNKWFNDFGFRARGKRDGNGQTPMRVFDPCTWNRHGYRIQDLGKRKDMGHPRLEFYHLEKLETKESRAPTRASERVAIRVAIEESLR